MEGALLALFELPLGVSDASGSNLVAKGDWILLVVDREDEMTGARCGDRSSHENFKCTYYIITHRLGNTINPNGV